MTATCQPMKCYSCADLEDFIDQVVDDYVIHTDPEQIEICRDHRHSFYPVVREEFQKDTKINRDKDAVDTTALEIMKNHKFITLRKTEEILTYNGKIFSKSDAESIIKEESEKMIENCTTHDRKEVVNKIKAKTFVNIDEFDKDPKLITVKNGILDLETLELNEHTPEHLSRVLLPVEYSNPKYEIKEETIFADIEKNLADTLFWKFLKSSFTVNGKLIKEAFETALEVTASVFIKTQINDKAIMNLGKGENGKSVLLEYIESILDKDNVSRIPLQEIAEDRFMCAELDGKSANIFTDLEQYELKKTGKIKAITSGEGIQVQRKHQQPFTLYPFCKLMFSCNRFPKVYDQTQGFFRRWVILKWERNFENDPKRDEHLKEKLIENKDEKNLVFSCLVFLARKLHKAGEFTHSKDWKTIQLEWNENADPVDDFVSNYIIESDQNTSVREVYHFYKDVMLEKAETPLGIGRFGKIFSEYYDQDKIKDNGKTERVWLNITLKKPQQTEMKDYDKS
jgi:P4 family phage/plasmid primase-like protien